MGHLSHVIHNAVRTFRFRNTGTPRIDEIGNEHVLIVDAIARQDSAAARHAMRTHLDNAMARYRKLLGDLYHEHHKIIARLNHRQLDR
jgi:DNA-binding FadR family transcriptional regulator